MTICDPDSLSIHRPPGRSAMTSRRSRSPVSARSTRDRRRRYRLLDLSVVASALRLPLYFGWLTWVPRSRRLWLMNNLPIRLAAEKARIGADPPIRAGNRPTEMDSMDGGAPTAA